jgi:hypothetical protein
MSLIRSLAGSYSMNERIRIVNLTRKLMIELGVGTYFPMVNYRLNNIPEEQIKRIYKIIKEETKSWV